MARIQPEESIEILWSSWFYCKKNILLRCCMIIMICTLKPQYNEPRYSEFRDIVNKTQLPFSGFTKHITSDIVNYSI